MNVYRQPHPVTGYVCVHYWELQAMQRLWQARDLIRSVCILQTAEQVWPPDQPSGNFKGNSIVVLCTSVTMVWGLVKYYTSSFIVWLCVTTNWGSTVFMPALKFFWRLKSSQRWHCVIGRDIPDILKAHSAFIFRKKQSKENRMPDPEDWDTTLSAMSVTLYQLTYNQMAEDLTITNTAV